MLAIFFLLWSSLEKGQFRLHTGLPMFNTIVAVLFEIVHSELIFGSGPNLARLCLVTNVNFLTLKKSEKLWHNKNRFFFAKYEKNLQLAWLCRHLLQPISDGDA